MRVFPLRICPFATVNSDSVEAGQPGPGRLNQEKVMSGNIVNVTDASFEQDVLKSDVPVLVDYWAEWCGPCKMIAPVLEEIADEYEGKLKVCKLNIEIGRASYRERV